MRLNVYPAPRGEEPLAVAERECLPGEEVGLCELTTSGAELVVRFVRVADYALPPALLLPEERPDLPGVDPAVPILEPAAVASPAPAEAPAEPVAVPVPGPADLHAEAVEFARVNGYPAAARKYGVSAQTIRNWKRAQA